MRRMTELRWLTVATVTLIAIGVSGCGTSRSGPVPAPNAVKTSPSESRPVGSERAAAQAHALLSRYGYHIKGLGEIMQRALPSKEQARQHPTEDTGRPEWASRVVGLDLDPYAGKTVQELSYTLVERAYGAPLSAVFLIADGRLVGAYFYVAGARGGNIQPLSWRP